MDKTAAEKNELPANVEDQNDTCLTICCCCLCFPIALVMWIFGGTGLFLAPAIGGAAAAADKSRRQSSAGPNSNEIIKSESEANLGPVEISRRMSRKMSKKDFTRQSLNRPATINRQTTLSRQSEV
eukprot:NODE_93_length_21530_cov_0.700387.p17 type:complete len:126 gc:universal NODE_93_length_21530_cov_0.700387:465-842(+)